MRFDLYEPGNSLIHRLDPRVKLSLLLEVFLTSVLFTSPTILVSLFVLVLLALLSTRTSWEKMRFIMGGLLSLGLMSLVLWPLFDRHGFRLWSLGPFEVTTGGLLLGAAMASRILAMVLASLVVMLTTSNRNLVLGLRGLGMPFRAAFTVALALRFLPIVVGIGKTITEAQRVRGLDLDHGSLLAKARKAAPVLGPLMLNSIRMAQQVAIAVQIRGFEAPTKRSDYYKLSMRLPDILVLGGGLAVFLVLIVIRVIGLNGL